MRIDISIDDGHISDLKVASLLSKYGFIGTFYIPNTQVAKTVQMSMKEIKEGIVGKGHELGGHTVSHPMDLKLLDDKQLQFELQNNKLYLEHLAGKPVTKFCYPRGRYDERVKQAVKDAGFLEARTTKVLKCINQFHDPFETPTTIHIFQRSEYQERDWLDLAKEYFQKALKLSRTEDNVFFSIWCHSKELDEYQEWEKLEEFLIYIKSFPHGAVATNVIE